MKFSSDDKTLLLVLDLNAPNGEEVPMAVLEEFFDRPARLRKSALSLSRWELIIPSAGLRTLRINREKVLASLRLKRPVELFSCAPEPAGTKNFAPVEKPKPPEQPPPKPFHANGFHDSHAHDSMPMTPAPPHVHVTCNSEYTKKIHVHGHDVGELNPRTTAEMLADIKRLNPAISAENLESWRARIERESAELVNAVIRQAQLQRGQIRNIGGWMNSNYLKPIRAKENSK